MIKHDLKNWIYTNDLEGLLFFAQRLNEALFDFSPDRYKAPTLFTISSCLELLRTASSVKNGVFPLKTLETVFEEFKSIYNKDIIAQELVGVDAKNYFLEITESNLEKFITGIELLIMKMPPREYLNLLKEKLKEAIVSCKRKREIEDYSLKYISILTHLGYTRDFLYRKTCDFFFKKNMINNVNNIDEFYSLFDLKVKRYNIYLKISRLFRPLEEMCKGFKISIVEDEELSSKLKLTPQDEILIKVEQIELYDPYGAQIYVDRLLNKINNLFTFYYHKQRLSWSAEAVVKEMDSKDEGFHIKKRVTSMQKGIDYYPQAAAKLLGKMLMEINLKKDSFFRINRGIDFHGTSIENNIPENQLIQNWIALETLIINNNEDSKINLILKGLIPVLNYLYIKQLFSNLSSDIQRLRDAKVDEIVNKVPEGESYIDKVVALCVLKSNLSIAQELLKVLSASPLLRYRIYDLNLSLSNSDCIYKYLKEHEKRVEWHIRRIYRTRNLITHSGKVPKFIESLVESSHSYLDKFINIMITLSAEEKQIYTIQQGIQEIQIRNRIHTNYLKNNPNTECDSSNFKLLLWGGF